MLSSAILSDGLGKLGCSSHFVCASEEVKQACHKPNTVRPRKIQPSRPNCTNTLISTRLYTHTFCSAVRNSIHRHRQALDQTCIKKGAPWLIPIPSLPILM
ncbi:hypothetical protein ILYODFUR_017611 [Ilyodon furcidens]|uniref:Uncharacterized protein n=1 Tax=Ilyodon furcidens TaxID=33524 RepID=A0ABV0TJP3_9TELE